MIRHGLQGMYTRSNQLHKVIQDMCIRSNSICKAKLRRLAALAAFEFFVNNYFAIHQNMKLVQWGNTYW